MSIMPIIGIVLSVVGVISGILAGNWSVVLWAAASGGWAANYLYLLRRYSSR